MLALDQHALLTAIRSHPDEDTPRLMYADYLDGLDTVTVPCPKCAGERMRGRIGPNPPPTSLYYECRGCRGTGTVPDTSNRDRAELIRVQIDLANFSTPRHHGETWDTARRYWNRREQQLIEQNFDRWRDPTGDDAGGLTSHKCIAVTYHRGMKRVACRAADVWHNVRVGGGHPESHYEWLPTPWALAVCRHHPDVCEISLTDRQPMRLRLPDHEHGWLWSDLLTTLEALPRCVWDMLTGGRVWRSDWKIYPTIDAARLTLTRALVPWVHTFLPREPA